jgi:hypothetical protein
VKSVTGLKREVSELQRRVGAAKKVTQQTPLSRWTFTCDVSRIKQEVDTAKRLGYTVEVHFDLGVLCLTAVKRQDA